MSLLSQVGIGAAANLLDTVLVRQGSSFAGIFPDVAIEEHHVDELELTRHPVEVGAPVSDHAYKQPSQITMRMAWSGNQLGAAISDVLSGDFGGAFKDVAGSPLKDQYNQLLALQSSLQPFSITSSKRTYKNMMMTRLATSTTKETYASLVIEASFREVQLVETKSGKLLPPIANQGLAAKTADAVDKGVVQAKQVDQSILSKANDLRKAVGF